MTKLLHKFISIVSLSICLIPTLLAQGPQINRSKTMFDSVYSKATRFYMEEPRPGRIIRPGIDAMLRSLDPYTSFMDSNEAQEFKVGLNGKFGGVGFTLNSVGGTTTITEIYKGYPADKAGLKPGDIITEVDGKSLKGMDFFAVYPMLRGIPGTTVRMTITRPATGKTLNITAVREQILLSSVPYYGMLPGNIGYISMIAETERSGEDVKKALLDLKSKQELKGLILDLRGNTGGLMNEAISVVNLFVEKGKPVLSEKSWYRDTTFYLGEDAVDTKLPLAVLTDSMTASSGEILSGALQDHDRGVIIGQKTYGKGLVQQLYDMPGGEMIKITTAYYCTPSGRCIQRKVYTKNKDGELIPDSQKKYFHTMRGRAVIDHDGVVPDIVMDIQPPAPVTQALATIWQYDQVFRFARNYVAAHPTIAPAATFRITDADYDAFVNFLKAEHFTLPGLSDEKLEELTKALGQEGYNDVGKAEMPKIREQLNQQKEKELYRYKNELKELVEGEIASQYYYKWGRMENGLKDDVVVKKALEILGNRALYTATLKQ